MSGLSSNSSGARVGIPATRKTYPKVQHAFNNDTTPRYDAAAAALAWGRTVEFFNKNLRG